MLNHAALTCRPSRPSRKKAKKQSYEEDIALTPQTHAVTHSHAMASVMAALPRISNALIRAKARADVLARIWDQLNLARSWWILEL